MAQWLSAPATLPETPGWIASTLFLLFFIFFQLSVVNTEKEGSVQLLRVWSRVPSVAYEAFSGCQQLTGRQNDAPKSLSFPEWELQMGGFSEVSIILLRNRVGFSFLFFD